jgi:purine-binding chemotaxis protein CheW
MRQLLVFQLGNETYGLDVVKVQKIVEDPVHFYIPRLSPPWRGAINVHGSILPVLDLAGFFEYSNDFFARRILVLSPDICALALAVTAVQGIVRLDEEDDNGEEDESVVEEMTPASGAFEVLSVADKKINVLDLEGLLVRLEKL